MQRINWQKLPADPDGMTFSDTKQGYRILYKQLAECKRLKGATESVLSKATKGEITLKKEKRVLKHQVQLISKRAAASQSFKQTSGWSAGAIGCVTLMWAGFGEYGYPGPKWLFDHEVVYGAACWVATTVFAWAAKSYYGVN